MVYVSYIALLLSTVVLADYDIDNADASVVYSMPATGQSWQTISMANPFEIIFSNNTGNYSIVLDSSNCYDQNYASAEGAPGCGTGSNCVIQIPFTGSGITMYVFNAGLSGMAASFSVDGGAGVSRSIAAPTAAENYQVSNVSLYDVQGLPSGNHTIKMTLIDWEGTITFMKFDYAHVNESFVVVPSSTTASSTLTTTSTARSSSQTPTQTLVPTASASNRVGVGGIVGITLGVVAVLGGIVIGIIFYRKRRASHQGSSSTAPESTFQVEPFIPEHLSSNTSSSRPYTWQHITSLSLQSDENSPVPPLMRSAILRDAHAAGNSFPSAPVAEEEPSGFLDSAIVSRYNLTPAQVETVRGLLARNLGRSAPADTISLVIEAFVSGEANAGQVIPSSEYARSLGSPPSYQTRDR